MGVLSSTVVALSAYYPEFLHFEFDKTQTERAIAQLMAQVKVIMAYFYRRSVGKNPVRSHPSLGYCADFLNMMFYKPGTKSTKDIARALNQLLILHADHEQNLLDLHSEDRL